MANSGFYNTKDVANLLGVATSVSLADFALHAEGNETAETKKRTHNFRLFDTRSFTFSPGSGKLLQPACNQRKL